MANGENTTPATTPDRIESSSVEFDPNQSGDTLEDKRQFLYDRLFGAYSETIALPQDTTVEEFKNFLKRDWKFRIRDNPALAAKLNELAPEIIDAHGEELYLQVVWAGKIVLPADESNPRRHYEQGGRPSGRGAVGTAADPVDLFNGNFSHQVTDLEIDGAGCRFLFIRSYRQLAAYHGPLGHNWDHNFNLWLRVSDDHSYVVVSEGRLQLQHYRKHNIHDYFVPPDGSFGILREQSGTFELSSPDGTTIVYSPHAGLSGVFVADRIVDRSGNQLQLLYGGGLLRQVQINHPGRDVFFSYDALDRIVALTDFTGRSWRYSYDDCGDLVAIASPGTSEAKYGLASLYAYSSAEHTDPAAQHNLTAVVDPDGKFVLENEYGIDKNLLSYNRVIRQREGSGDTHFDYADVVEDFPFGYRAHEKPAHQTLVTERDGRQVRYLFNSLGNTVLKEEYARLNGVPRIVSTHYRYNIDGQLIGILSPVGATTQYLFGRDYYESQRTASEDYQYVDDPDLTAKVRCGFGNLLGTVRRGRYLNLALLSTSGGLWSTDIFPSIFDTTPEDVITKFTYHDQFNQMQSSSDPRFTTSAHPDFNEPQNYQRHLTHFTYVPETAPGPFNLASVTLPAPTLPDGTSLGPVVTRFDRYDSQGRLLRTIGPSNLVVANHYYLAADGLREGFLRRVVIDPEGLNIASGVERDELGRVILVLRPPHYDLLDGRYSSALTYNSLDQVISNTSTAPFSVRERFTYDGAGNIKSSVIDLRDVDNAMSGSWGRHNRYDDESRLIRQVEGQLPSGPSRIGRVVFDRAGRPAISIEPSGYKEKYVYNERGLKSKSIADFGSSNAISKFSYDADGRLVRTTDQRGYSSKFSYDALGRLIEEEDALGHRTIVHYNKAGNIVVLIEFEKSQSNEFRLVLRKQYQYDEINRLTVEGINRFDSASVVSEAQLGTAFLENGPGELLTTHYFFDQSSKLFRVEDYSGEVHQVSYDQIGRLMKTTDMLGNEELFSYDKENNLIRHDQKESVLDTASGAVVAEHHFASSMVYDELNRVISSTDTLGNRASYRYDSRSNLVEWLGPLGGVSRNEFDIFSRKITKWDVLQPTTPGGASQALETRYRYNLFGLVDQVTDPLGRATRFQYDTSGRLVSTILPDDTADSASYDQAGNLSVYVDRNKLRKTFSYDPLNRNVGISVDLSQLDPMLTAGGATSYHTEYDALGRITIAENDASRIVLEYNSLDDALVETVHFKTHPGALASTGLTIRRNYDLAGQPVALHYPAGRAIEFDRDALERVVRISQSQKGAGYPGSPSAADGVTIAEVEYEGLRCKTISRSNNTSTLFQYDRGGRVIGMHHRHGSGTLLEMQWLYDALGNMRKRTERSAVHESLLFYRFDSLSRLVETSATNGSALVDLAELGPSPGPIPQAIPNFQGTIDAHLTNSASNVVARYFLDGMGNRLSTEKAGIVAEYYPDRLDQYQIDSMRYDKNGNLIEDADRKYAYDHANQLIRLTDKSSGLESTFAYDALGRRCVRSDSAGQFFMFYDGEQLIEEYQGATLKSSLVADVDEGCVLTRASGQQEMFYLVDVGRSTRFLLDGEQTSRSYLYDEFGNVMNGELMEDGEFLYSGKRFIAAARKYEFHFRVYDPQLGRFVQRDPAGYVDGLNMYAYAGNNPVTFTDRSGTERQPLLLGKELGADFASEALDFNDPNLGMDSISKFYFRDDGLLLRWNENTESWVEDFTGAVFIESQAPQPKGSWLERYTRGVKRSVMAPVHLAKDTAAKVVDMSTQGFAVLGQVTGGWDVGYTTWSSTSQAVNAGVPQSTLIWEATGGLVVDPIVGLGDQMVGLASGQTDLWGFAGELVGKALTGGASGRFNPNVGRYSKVKGHHIHQSASYRTALRKNPNHDAAITIQQGVKGFTKKDHTNASRAQRNINRAGWDKTVNRPVIGPLRIQATGKVGKNHRATPSQWFEDIKAFYALRAAGIDPNRAFQLVEQSLSQIQAAKVTPKRVPKM